MSVLQSARADGDGMRRPPGHLITGAGREEVMRKGGGEEVRSVRCTCDVCAAHGHLKGDFGDFGVSFFGDFGVSFAATVAGRYTRRGGTRAFGVSGFYIRPTVVQTGPFWYLSVGSITCPIQ